MESTSEFQHALRIWKTVPPFLILFGTLGNIITIIVLLRRKNRHSSTATYLCALAFSDLLVLYSGLLRQWIKYMFDVDVRQLSVPGCMLHIFTVYFSTQCSSWLLVAVTCERFIGVWLPHKFKQGCTQTTAVIVIAVIVTSLTAINSHWYYGMGKVTFIHGNDTSISMCAPVKKPYAYFLEKTWPWIDMCLFALIPFSILLFGNMAIIVRVLLRKYVSSKMGDLNKSTRKTKERTSQMAGILVALNAVFLICTIPMSIYLIWQHYWLLHAESEHEKARLKLWWALVNCFMYLNNTLNFVLYVLSGSRFRLELKAMLVGGNRIAIFETGLTRASQDTERGNVATSKSGV